MKPKEKLLEYARTNRKNATLAERTLWEVLRKKKMGVRFHRQKPMCGFILDFWCPKAKLAVEVDGESHNPEYDARRDAILGRYGILTLRFKNSELFGDVLGVRAAIRETVSFRCATKLTAHGDENIAERKSVTLPAKTLATTCCDSRI